MHGTCMLDPEATPPCAKCLDACRHTDASQPCAWACAGFPTNTAVALSNITIVGGAISNFAFNVPRRHTHFDRPLIDWDLILVMEPATILGALLGGYLNKVQHPWCLTCSRESRGQKHPTASTAVGGLAGGAAVWCVA